MKLTRQNLSNVAIAAVAVLLFGGFVVLATRGDNKGSDLASVAPTTTTKRATTTTTEETTTSLLAVTSTTAPPTGTTTTAQTNGTVPRTTTTTSAFTCPPRGPQSTESSDNATTFTHGQDGSVSENPTDPGSGGNLLFTIHAQKAEAGSDPSQVVFVLRIENKTRDHCFYFPADSSGSDVASFTVTLAPSSGESSSFPVTAGAQTPLKPGEALKITAKNSVPYGSFTASATSNVNYS